MLVLLPVEALVMKALVHGQKCAGDRLLEARQAVKIWIRLGTAVVLLNFVKRGLKAGDLITAIGGRGGGRPNMAQGSLPDATMMNDAMNKVARTVEEKLK